jgi:hypothetical protein
MVNAHSFIKNDQSIANVPDKKIPQVNSNARSILIYRY